MNAHAAALTVATEQRGDVQVIRVRGPMDYFSIGPLREEVNRHLSAGVAKVVLDLYGVPFCDSTGLSLLLTVQQRTESAGGWLRLARPHLQMRRMLAITRLDRHLDTYRSIQDAIGDTHQR